MRTITRLDIITKARREDIDTFFWMTDIDAETRKELLDALEYLWNCGYRTGVEWETGGNEE